MHPIISHGASGTVQLGDGMLTTETLRASTAIWEQIGQSLSADADILLYGCNVAQGQSGRTFLDRLARITNADVAASTDITGAGGNWVLEANSGDIEAALPTEALARSPPIPAQQGMTRSPVRALTIFSPAARETIP